MKCVYIMVKDGLKLSREGVKEWCLEGDWRAWKRCGTCGEERRQRSDWVA